MNRRGFLRSLGAGLVAAAAVTRLATTKVELAGVLPVSEGGDGVALNNVPHPHGFVKNPEFVDDIARSFHEHYTSLYAADIGVDGQIFMARYSWNDGFIKVEEIPRESVFLPDGTELCEASLEQMYVEIKRVHGEKSIRMVRHG